ncbi:nitrilotriacetate monooxygenase [Staphylococcus rostri]|uniref:Nitrilotriacetate monooxygenase n=1 Tax=Staphylococcus rostri TaxID=522262 RepID=A0A2K3YFS1_9STAP|nr:NtaA/DmoA family FMN-dependent monooxygenase [Staphylococcus rostri]PNZ24460.1 nitrilotriacetate monooxygenase [Staphylococcus rostri]
MAKNKEKQMVLGLLLGPYGANSKAWTENVESAKNYPDINEDIRAAQLAEKGKFQFMFFGDFPAIKPATSDELRAMVLDPIIMSGIVASHTKHLGLAITKATSWNNVYDVAREFKTLDAVSNGRVGWNAVTGANEVSANAFGASVGSSKERYEEAYEFVEFVQELWSVWDKDALQADKDSGIFADYEKVRTVSLKGKYNESIGTLPIPPSPQGQPVIVHAGGSSNSIAFAGRYANVFIGEVWTIEQGQAMRQALRQAAVDNGRDPDEIKFIAGLMPLIGDNKREALDRHAKFIDEKTFRQRIAHIGYALNTRFGPQDIDQPINKEILDRVVVTPYSDPRIDNVLKLAYEGWTLRDLVYHSVIDYHPAAVGDAKATADHLTEWFEAGAADGFWIMPDTYEVDFQRFVDEVVPILQERGVFHEDYEGETLRENLNIPYQYGRDERLES